MMHPTEGTLRAYLDGELEAAQIERVAVHLRLCAACRWQLDALSARSASARRAMDVLAPRPSEAPLPASVALARLKQAAAQSRRAATQQQRNLAALLRTGVENMFSNKFRPVWATLAIIAVIGILSSFAPVRAAASQFLGLFRVRKFAVISINPQTLENMDNAGVQEQIANVFSEDVTIVREPSEPVPVASAEEASQKAGVRVRLPSALGAPDSLEVQNGLELRYTFDAERARAALDMMGKSKLQIPAGLDGAVIHVDIQPMVSAEFGAEDQKVTLIQANSPSIDLPPNVDVNVLGETLLQLWGLSPDEARAAAAKIDWMNTLVIPMPTNMASYREVTVEGSQGLFVEQTERRSDRPMFTLLWQKDDVVYGLIGYGTFDGALEIVNSMP